GTITARLSKKPEAGELALDTGALVSRVTYPDLWAWVQANAPLLSEADWQAQAAVQTSVGAYSTGDGSTTFRLPRLLDYFRGGAVADVGKWQGDAIRNIVASSIGGSAGRADRVFTHGDTFFNGAFKFAHISNANIPTGSGAGLGSLDFDASRVVPTADENRPKTIKVLYCVKAFDAETNPGLVDLTALANEMAGKVDKTTYAADFAKNFGASGYQKLPSGLILQWGTTASAITSDGRLTVTFPIAFPTNCLFVGGNPLDDSISGSLADVASVRFGSKTVTSFMAMLDSYSTANTLKIMWFALGY
ncbi:MAG: gp53-like domain-containing protein, partial [Shewanella sp.]